MSATLSSSSLPRLAPPGAGLPPPEQFIARRLFRLKCWLGSRPAFAAEFEAERRRILERVAQCDPARRGERVLIPRLRGLEDSSRYWSVWMTLEHLRITNEAFARVVGSLASGVVPEGEASMAAVKPGDDVGEAVEAAFAASCMRFTTTVAGVAELRTRVKFAHPWFGPLDAAQWHALAAMHMGIHRRQIERILKDLPR